VEYQQDVEKMIPIKSRSKPHRAPAPLKIFLLKMNVIFAVSEKFRERGQYWLLLYCYTIHERLVQQLNTPSNDVLMASLSPHHS